MVRLTEQASPQPFTSPTIDDSPLNRCGPLHHVSPPLRRMRDGLDARSQSFSPVVAKWEPELVADVQSSSFRIRQGYAVRSDRPALVRAVSIGTCRHCHVDATASPAGNNRG